MSVSNVPLECATASHSRPVAGNIGVASNRLPCNRVSLRWLVPLRGWHSILVGVLPIRLLAMRLLAIRVLPVWLLPVSLLPVALLPVALLRGVWLHSHSAWSLASRLRVIIQWWAETDNSERSIM